MHSLIRSACLLFGSASLASAATSLINVDFGAGTTMTGGAVLGTTGDAWNKPTTGGSGSSLTFNTTALNWSDSSASGISLSTVSGTFFGNGSNPNISNLLMKDYAYMYVTGSSTYTFRLSGFTANTTLASIVLYGNGDQVGQNAAFAINGGTPTATTASSNAPAAPNSSTPVGDMYVRFDNVLVDGSGNVDITWSNPLPNTGGGQWSAFNGMQIQTVPEPSAALLGGLGVLALLRRRR